MGKSDSRDRITLLERSFDLIEYILKHSSLDGENYLQSINNFIDALKEKSPDDFEKKALEEARIKINSLSLDELKEMQELISDEPLEEDELSDEPDSLIMKLMRTENGFTFKSVIDGEFHTFLMKMKINLNKKLYFMVVSEENKTEEVMFLEYLYKPSDDSELLIKVTDKDIIQQLLKIAKN